MPDYIRKLQFRLEHAPTSVVRPSTPDPVAFDGEVFIEINANLQLIDWIQWSLDPTNGDPFDVASRMTGNQYYAHTGAVGDGTLANPWSAGQMKTQVDNRALPADSVINLAAGNYGNIGQFTGGGGGGGWVTLLGPTADQGKAEIRGDFDRYWSMRSGASRIMFARLWAENPDMVSKFNAYAQTGGARTNDQAMSDAIGVQDVACIGFQLDGFSKPIPTEMMVVSCAGIGLGEAVGSFEAGNVFALGCWAHQCAIASPNGRSGFSISTNGGGSNTGAKLVTGLNGVDYHGGTYACLATHNAQMVDSAGIGISGEVADGNGFNVATDTVDAPGKWVQGACISIGSGTQGSNGYTGAKDGMYVNQSTHMLAGLHHYHRKGEQPLGFVSRMVESKPGWGAPLLIQRYGIGEIGGAFGESNLNGDYYVTGNVAIHDPGILGETQAGFNGNQASFVQFGNKVVMVANRGNIGSSYGIGGISSTENALDLVELTSLDLSIVNPSLTASSAAIGAAYESDLVFDVDFYGRPFTKRAGGRVDAGAITAA